MKNLSAKQKFHLLLAAIAVLAIAIYILAIKKTLTLRTEAKELQDKAILMRDIPAKTAQLKQKLKQMDLVLSNKESVDSKEELMEIVSNICQENKLVLREFPQTKTYSSSGYQVETNLFVVEGSFLKILNLIYSLEQEFKVGKVSSANFQVKKDPRTEITSLSATIYIQNIANKTI